VTPFGLKRPHDIFHILTDHPRHGCGLVGSGVLRLIDVDRRVSTPETYQFLAFSTDLRKAERVFILKIIFKTFQLSLVDWAGLYPLW
jgi:hypothetical protein